MVTKVFIKNNDRTPIGYLPNLENFRNGKTYEFKAGVNIIVGENGCGKTTLINLIKKYLLVDHIDCGAGAYNCNINHLTGYDIIGNRILDGVDVYADYTKNTFRMCHHGELNGDEIMENFETFRSEITQNTSSKGEGVLVGMNYLFSYIFGKDAILTFDYSKFENTYPQYVDYVKKHKVECADEYTILMDEPDRNLSIGNISQLKSILSFHKPHTQIIAAIHNPLLICSLSKIDSVNFIEMTDGYVKKVVDVVKSLQ